MAERPIATAPERSMAALSTTTTFRPFFFAQYAASKAAPQADIPPPTIRRSVSTTSVSKFGISLSSFSERLSLQGGNSRRPCRTRFCTQHVRFDVVRSGREAGKRVNFTFRSGPDGELETL